jgi:hypothetical protein
VRCKGEARRGGREGRRDGKGGARCREHKCARWRSRARGGHPALTRQRVEPQQREVVEAALAARRRRGGRVREERRRLAGDLRLRERKREVS